MRAALNLFGIASVAAVANSGFVAPVASGYIYRSDNNGPASLIQLGAVPYQQPHAFAPPIPVAGKLQALEAYNLIQPAPAPLPYIAPKPIEVIDAEDDDDDDADDDNDDYLESEEGPLEGHHGHGIEKGAGSEYGAEHHEAHGEKGSKGYKKNDHHSEGEAGSYGKGHKEGFYKEGEGVEKSHHDESDAHGKHFEAGKNYKGGEHGHKKHFSKGEDITGYHKVFHKDEFKKDHDFYDVADNSGHFNKYDKGHKHHVAKEGAHKEGENHDAGFDKKGAGKAGFHAEGKVDESEEGHSAEEGNESQYSHEEDFGRKGGKKHEKQYDFDDGDDEDDDEEEDEE